MSTSRLFGGMAALALLGATTSAHAALTEVDLSPYVNLGFQNSWYINGGEFTPIIGSTNGNQGSSVPFLVANAPDTSGQGGDNNFWYGLWGGPGNQLSGPPLSVTIPVNGTGVRTVYTLADNTFGSAGTSEYGVTFTGTGGTINDLYIGANNTKDYNFNCSTTGCDATPRASYWFIDGSGAYPGDGQWLQMQTWSLPAGFDLQSVTFTQINGTDGAIIAGLTLSTSAVPEPATWSMLLLGVGFAGAGLRMARRKVQLARATN